MQKFLFIISLTVLFINNGCSQRKVESKAYNLTLQALLSHNVPEITVQQMDTMKNITILDARTKKEYETSHINNAIWVGYDDFDTSRVDEIAKNKMIVVYCAVGYRSEKISEKLIKAGYTNVSNLYGGIFEWKNQGKTVYNAEGPTENIHAYDKVWGVWLKKGKKVY